MNRFIFEFFPYINCDNKYSIFPWTLSTLTLTSSCNCVLSFFIRSKATMTRRTIVTITFLPAKEVWQTISHRSNSDNHHNFVSGRKSQNFFLLDIFSLFPVLSVNAKKPNLTEKDLYKCGTNFCPNSNLNADLSLLAPVDANVVTTFVGVMLGLALLGAYIVGYSVDPLIR